MLGKTNSSLSLSHTLFIDPHDALRLEINGIEVDLESPLSHDL